MPLIQFNKGITNVPDRLSAIINEKPYYLRIKITRVVFTEGYEHATDIVIAIEGKEKIELAKYKELNGVNAFRVITVNEEFEFVIDNFKLNVEDTPVKKFNFTLHYENINE